MKHLKEKLFATIAMLLVATVMLTSASFAWFSISTAPEVTNITAKVTSNGNLEIALDNGENKAPETTDVGDSGKNQKWGNLIDVASYFDSANITLKPVKAVSFTGATGDFQKPNYGLDGRIKSLDNLTRVDVADNTSAARFGDLGGVHAYSEKTDASTGDAVYAFEVDYWLRTNVDGNNISLSTSTPRDSTETAGLVGSEFGSEDGLGSWVTDNTTTIVIADGSNYYVAVPGTKSPVDNRCPLTLRSAELANGKLTIGDVATISLTKNVAKELKMFVYLSGAEITNQTVNTVDPDTLFGLNIQFVGDKTLNDMNVLENENGAFNGDTPYKGTHTDNKAT